MNDAWNRIELRHASSLPTLPRLDHVDRSLQTLCERLGLLVISEAIYDVAIGSDEEDVGQG